VSSAVNGRAGAQIALFCVPHLADTGCLEAAQIG